MSGPRASLLATLLIAGCRVYDPARLDASHDAPDAHDAAPDAGDVVVRDVADAADVAVEASSCASVLAAGAPCIEGFSGQAWSADDPRLIAPAPLAVVESGASPTLVVGDTGSGRLLSFASDPLHGTRVAGTGAFGIPVADGDARATPLTSPSALLPLASGDVLFGDAAAHALYTYRAASTRIERFGRLVYSAGPFALAQTASDTLLVAADNQIFQVALTAGAPTSSTSILGQACGNACPGFNAAPAAGSATQFAQPTGVDFDANAIYIADSANCRIRRAARTGTPAFLTTVFAGAGCDATDDILAGGTSIAATAAHLGPVGDVRVGSDGTVYFTDPIAHCAILAVPTTGPTSGQLSVVLGSSQRCGDSGPGGVALGRLGGIALSADRATLYFADRENQRVGRIALPASATPTVTWVANAGPSPATGEAAAAVRVGGVGGVAFATDSAGASSVYWAGAAEGRIYQAPDTGASASVFAGNGSQRLATPMPVTQLEPGSVAGLSYGGGDLYIGLREHSLIAYAEGTQLFPVAGSYDQSGSPALGSTMASADRLASPGWPVVSAGALYFSSDGAGARVYRVDGAMPSSPITVVAGVAPGADAGAAPADGGTAMATSIALGQPEGLAFDASGNLYVADTSNSVVWRVHADGTIEIAAGILGSRFGFTDADSDARSVAIPTPIALAFDGTQTLYIADVDLQRVRALNVTTGRLVTVAGSGPIAPNGATDSGDGTDARTATLGRPTALAWSGDRLYVGMLNTGRVRVIRPAPAH